MATQPQYTILFDKYGGRSIEVRSGAVIMDVVVGFPYEDKANTWIREQRRRDIAKS